MGQLPITSRLKRTAFQLRAVAKQNKKGKLGEIATSGGTSEGSTETIETKSIKKGQKVEKLLLPEDFEGGAKNPEYIKKKKALDDAIAKGADEKYKDKEVIEKKTIDKPGVDFDVDYKQSNKGRFLTYDQQRDSDLMVKRAGRNTRIAGNKLDKTNRKLAKLAEKGITSGRRFDRLTRKQKENTEELEAFKSGQANTRLAVDAGGAQGEQYQKADTDLTKGQQGLEAQKAEGQRLAERAARKEAQQNAAESQGVTTGQSGGSVGQSANAVDPGSSAGGMFDVGTFAPTDYSKILQGNSALAKKGYSQKAKSVAARKLQGAQGKLPSHLQEAIKAAPNQKSSLKKSYFKNK